MVWSADTDRQPLGTRPGASGEQAEKGIPPGLFGVLCGHSLLRESAVHRRWDDNVLGNPLDCYRAVQF